MSSSSTANHSARGVILDPIRLEIAWSRLIATVEEAASTLRRTALSQVIRESFDYTCVILTPDGDVLAQSSRYTLPGFIKAASSVARSFRKVFTEWAPGDVAITNDPWIAAGHLHDVGIGVPIFDSGKLLGFSLNIAHQTDMGGRGLSADAATIYEEGLQIPPMKLYRAGEPAADVLQLIKANVRLGDVVLDDLQAQIAAARLGGIRLVELVQELGLDDLSVIADPILTRSEDAMRRAIADLRDGVYRNEIALDGYEEPLSIAVTVVVDGDELTVDFEGTSEQVDRGINSSYNYTYGYTAFAIKAVLEPQLPNNEGCFRPVVVRAPEGSLVNCVRPAPVSARGLIGHAIVPLVLGALLDVLPEQVMAEAGAPAPRAALSGFTTRGEPFHMVVITSAGMGARRGRDGASCKAFPTNTSLSSIEMIENAIPVRFLQREMICDSGGAGAHRGGLGQAVSIRYIGDHICSASVTAERTGHQPQGAFEGLEATPNTVLVDDEAVDGKATVRLNTGQVITFRTAGGGGYGDPRWRDADALQADLDDGYVSVEAAQRDYLSNLAQTGTPDA